MLIIHLILNYYFVFDKEGKLFLLGGYIVITFMCVCFTQPVFISGEILNKSKKNKEAYNKQKEEYEYYKNQKITSEQPKPFNQNSYNFCERLLCFKRDKIGNEYKINYGTYCCGCVKAPFYKRILRLKFEPYLTKLEIRYENFKINLKKLINCKDFCKDVNELIEEVENPGVVKIV